MRTTVTLEPDVEVRLRRLMDERGLSFKDALNETLRAGLDHERDVSRAGPYVVPEFDLGLRPDIDYDRVGHLMDELEDEDRLRAIREGR
jgi:hypothetical protein